MSEYVFLKLGGALLTVKGQRETPRPVMPRLAREIAAWPGTRAGRLVLAHGSGSFAHMAVVESGFLDQPADPFRAAYVAAAARRLNSLVVDALLAEGVPAMAVPGSLVAECQDGQVRAVRSEPVMTLLAGGYVPVLYGDAAPDRTQGGAIASTEPLLVALAGDIPPRRVILATDVDGVYTGDPQAAEAPAAQHVARITPSSAPSRLARLGGSGPGATDVSGGMASKVAHMLALVAAHPQAEVRILSGLRPGAVLAALSGREEAGGTLICAR